VPAEPKGLEIAEGPVFGEDAVLDHVLERFQIRRDGVGRLFDQQPVLMDEVGIVLLQLVVFQVIGFPFLLAILARTLVSIAFIQFLA
jgi:hypothetical protein